MTGLGVIMCIPNIITSSVGLLAGNPNIFSLGAVLVCQGVVVTAALAMDVVVCVAKLWDNLQTQTSHSLCQPWGTFHL